MELYIVNEIDRPCERHIAEMRDDGKLYYIHPDLRDNKTYHGMVATHATKLEDFGISFMVNNGVLTGIEDGPSIAKYPEGRIRKWQGMRNFHFRLN